MNNIILYEKIWVNADLLVLKLIKNEKVFLKNYSGCNIIFLFVVSFILAKYVYDEIDISELYVWFMDKLDKYKLNLDSDVSTPHEIFYDYLLECSKYLKKLYKEKSIANINFIYALTDLIQRKLPACNKSLDSKIIIAKEIAKMMNCILEPGS